MRTLLFERTISLLLLVSVSACSSKETLQPRSEIITVSGRVINHDPIRPIIKIVPNRITNKGEEVTASLDENGYFKASFESFIPVDFFIHYTTNYLVLAHPGDSIYVEFNGVTDDRLKLLEDIKFSGDFANQNQEAAIFQQMYYSHNTFEKNSKTRSVMNKLNPSQFKMFMDSCYKESIILLKKFEKESEPSDEILNWAKVTLEIDYYRDLLRYPNYYKKNHPDKSIPLAFFDFLKEFRINKSDLINAYSLFGFVDFYAIYISEIIRNENSTIFNSQDYFKKNPEILDSLIFFGIVKNTTDPLLRQMSLSEMLFEKLEVSNIGIFDKYQKEIDEIITEPYLREPILKEYHNTRDRLSNPIIASDIVLEKLKGSSVLSSIDSIIRINKGKVLYIDCWATWCGPCISEMPNTIKLIQKFKGKDVAFIFVCIDSEEQNWKAALDKYSLEGHNVLLNKKQSEEFRQIFNINGIPHYILFDKEGIMSKKILSPLEAYNLIDDLLK